jgi:drug/metabolite transporter (DMT)-like permease
MLCHYKMSKDWVMMAIVSAILFGIGDFIVVYSEDKRMNIITLYVTYTILIGLLNLIYLIVFRTDSIKDIYNFGIFQWNIVLGLCFFYFFAYMLHFFAIQKASNPGYANALVMFHVIVLTMLSYYFLSKPLNIMTMMGIGLIFVGGYLVTMYS